MTILNIQLILQTVLLNMIFVVLGQFVKLVKFGTNSVLSTIKICYKEYMCVCVKKLIYSTNDYLKYITNIVDSPIKYDQLIKFIKLVKVAKLVKNDTNLPNLLQMPI